MIKTIANLADEYILYLESLNYSKVTIRNVQLDLSLFLKHLDCLGALTAPDLRKAHIFSWQEHIPLRKNGRGVPVGPETVNQKIGRTKGFLKFMALKGHVLASLDVLRRVKSPKTLPGNILPHAKIRKMFSSMDTSRMDSYRDRTILELLYSSAIRAGEAISLDISAIDFSGAVVKVYGKGRKERMVPVGTTAMRFLETYVRAVRPFMVNGRSGTALFLGRSGDRLGYCGLKKIVRKHCGKTGDVWVTPHTFRRSCTTELVREGANIYHVKELLGHESLSTLKHYTKLTINDLRKTHEKFHPREKDR